MLLTTLPLPTVTPSSSSSTATTKSFLRYAVQVHCSSDSKPRRGFGPIKTTSTNNKQRYASDPASHRMCSFLPTPLLSFFFRKSSLTTEQSASPLPSEAPGLSSRFEGKSKRSSLDIEFEERLAAVRRSALEQKKEVEIKEFGPIDYDAPVEKDEKTVGLGTKIGVGVAVLVFGLVFALGDFLPSGSDGPSGEVTAVNKKLSEEEKTSLQARLNQYEATLGISPKDPVALEGAAVTLAELGEYNRATSLLQDLAKEKPSDPEVFRLLGEVKYELKDYEGSVAAYKISSTVSKNFNFEVLRGLTNALLSAKKPDEAVQILLASRARLNSEKSSSIDVKADSSAVETESQKSDRIQVDLLLGKAYSDWGHVSDAVSVYDQLISSHPDDFRGYLAKGIILKENGNIEDSERMFIQEKAKALVDRYARK